MFTIAMKLFLMKVHLKQFVQLNVLFFLNVVKVFLWVGFTFIEMLGQLDQRQKREKG